MLYQMGSGEVTHLIPTIGFNVETLTHRSAEQITSFTVWDVGGRCSMRMWWRQYYKDAEALIFVVDSSSHDRHDEAKDQLDLIIMEDELRHKPLLVFANKQDLPDALKPVELAERLGLHSKDFQGRCCHVQGCSGLSGDGVVEGLDWLHSQLAGNVASVAKQPLVGCVVAPVDPKSSGDAASKIADGSAPELASDTDSTADTETRFQG